MGIFDAGGESIAFYVTAFPQRQHIVGLISVRLISPVASLLSQTVLTKIKAHGGTVKRSWSSDAITLVNSKVRTNPPPRFQDECYSYEFVEACIANGAIVPLQPYLASARKVRATFGVVFWVKGVLTIECLRSHDFKYPFKEQAPVIVARQGIATQGRRRGALGIVLGGATVAHPTEQRGRRRPRERGRRPGARLGRRRGRRRGTGLAFAGTVGPNDAPRRAPCQRNGQEAH